MCSCFTAAGFGVRRPRRAFDEIGSVLKVKQLQQTKRELFESLELFFRVFYLGEDIPEETKPQNP